MVVPDHVPHAQGIASYPVLFGFPTRKEKRALTAHVLDFYCTGSALGLYCM